MESILAFEAGLVRVRILLKLLNGSLAQLDRAFPCEGRGYEFKSRKNHMAKIDKKKKRLQERIEFLENEMKTNLKQKTSNTAEISVGDYMSKIQALNKELSELK